MTPSRDERIYTKQRHLRHALLDRSAKAQSSLARDLASELLLYLDDSKTCWRLATDRLRTALEVERVDGGVAAPMDASYHPGQSESLSDIQEIPSLSGITVSNCEDGMRLLWGSDRPIVFRSIRNERSFGPRLRSDLERAGVSTKLAYALHDENGRFALLCADRVMRGEREWQTWQYELFEGVAKHFLGPILGAVRYLEENCPSIDAKEVLATLSTAERKVARLVASGASYKEIASSLNRSPFTVDHHLRNIRAKLHIESHAKLTSFLGGYCRELDS
jgi:DNA-binding CsgD family transcriptional regulator